jgi:hypothetical protein
MAVIMADGHLKPLLFARTCPITDFFSHSTKTSTTRLYEYPLASLPNHGRLLLCLCEMSLLKHDIPATLIPSGRFVALQNSTVRAHDCVLSLRLEMRLFAMPDLSLSNWVV